MRTTRTIHLINVQGRRALVERTRAAGAGPPIVLLPSMLVRAKTYRWLTDRLRQKFDTIVLDPPGSGRGSQLEQPWSFQQYSDFLIATLDALELDRVTLLTHSNSGPVGLLAAAQHPQRFSKLILADVTGFAPAPVWRLAVGRFIDGVMEAPFSMNALRDVAFNTLVHRATLANQIRLASQADLTSTASLIRVPTLIAWGKLDFTFPVSAARKLHALIPGSKLEILESGSHDWLVQWSSDFAAAVDRFINAP